MKKLFCTYNISLKLKELGFDEPCFGHYETKVDIIQPRQIYNWLSGEINKDLFRKDVDILAPLWQQAIEFLLKGLQQKYPYIHIMYVNPNKYSILIEQPKDTFTGRDYVEYGVETIEELVLKMIELYNIKNT